MIIKSHVDGSVELGDRSVAIADASGMEVIRWLSDEWFDEPGTTWPMLHLVGIALSEGVEALCAQHPAMEARRRRSLRNLG